MQLVVLDKGALVLGAIGVSGRLVAVQDGTRVVRKLFAIGGRVFRPFGVRAQRVGENPASDALRLG